VRKPQGKNVSRQLEYKADRGFDKDFWKIQGGEKSPRKRIVQYGNGDKGESASTKAWSLGNFWGLSWGGEKKGIRGKEYQSST